MSYYSLPRVKVHKKDEIKKMNNRTSNYSRPCYKDRVNDVDIDLPSTVANKILAEGQPLTDDIKNFLLGTSDYARSIQSDIDLYVTRGRHNQVSFRYKLNPIEKSVWRTENPLALLFKDVANFDVQNPIIGSLLREIDLGKRSTNSDLIKKSLSKAPDINDTILLQRFKKFKETPINYNDNDDDNDDDDNNINNSKNFNYNNISLSPPPSPVELGDIFETAPPSFNFNNVDLQQQQQQKQQQQQQRQQPFDRFSTAAAPGTQVMSEIEKVIEKEKTKEQEKEITPSDPLLEYFKNADEILNDNFILEKEKNQAELENFKKQYQIDMLTDEIDQGHIPEILEFYFGGPDNSFFAKTLDPNPDEDTMLFMQFLATDYGSQIMKQNRVSIHSSTSDLYYGGVNTNGSLFDFIVSQKNTMKKRIIEKLYYGGTFEQYLSEFLPAFDADADAKLDTLTNKSIKYLFY